VRIFLVRHGDADAEVPEGLGDEARALTAKARQQIGAHFASVADRIGVGTVGLMLTSPLVRAVQTAQILTTILKYEGPLRAHRSLLPDMPVGAMDAIINEHASNDLILVGHSPSMGAMAAYLLGQQSIPKPVNPGTVIGLERGEGTSPARLLFYAAPGQPLIEEFPP